MTRCECVKFLFFVHLCKCVCVCVRTVTESKCWLIRVWLSEMCLNEKIWGGLRGTTWVSEGLALCVNPWMFNYVPEHVFFLRFKYQPSHQRIAEFMYSWRALCSLFSLKAAVDECIIWQTTHGLKSCSAIVRSCVSRQWLQTSKNPNPLQNNNSRASGLTTRLAPRRSPVCWFDCLTCVRNVCEWQNKPTTVWMDEYR